jgi:putative addiction module component (TIGR02574 family)
MNAALMKKLSKLSIDDRRALIDDLWDSIESELDSLPVSKEVGRLLDERAAQARDPKRKKFTLKQIAARHIRTGNIKPDD